MIITLLVLILLVLLIGPKAVLAITWLLIEWAVILGGIGLLLMFAYA